MIKPGMAFLSTCQQNMSMHSHPKPDATAVVGVVIILISVILTAVFPAQHRLDILRHGHHPGPHATEAGGVLLEPLKIFLSLRTYLSILTFFRATHFENGGDTLPVNVVVDVTYLEIVYRWHIALTYEEGQITITITIRLLISNFESYLLGLLSAGWSSRKRILYPSETGRR